MRQNRCGPYGRRIVWAVIRRQRLTGGTCGQGRRFDRTFPSYRRIRGPDQTPLPLFQQCHTAILIALHQIPPDRGKRVASDGGEAVVDEQLGAIDKICIIAGQIEGRAGDVFGLAKAALRGFDGRF